MTDPDAIREQLNALRTAYVEQLPAKLQTCEALWADCRRAPEAEWTGAVFQTLRRTVHGMAGAGTTFGLPGVSGTARALDSLLETLAEGAGAPTAEQAMRVEALLEALRQAAAGTVPWTPPAASAPDAAWSGRTNRAIVLVEGDAALARDLTLQISHYGYDVRPVTSLAGAQAALGATPPAAVILNVEFLARGARALLAPFQARGNVPPVIFISARHDLETHLLAVRAGGKAFFTQPVDVAVLVDRLDVLTARATSEPYRVLIVDDEPALARYHALTLEQAGVTTAVVTDPMQVMQPLIEFRPDLILMDMYMPGCSGLELAAVIRQQEAFVGVPIVFLSLETQLDRQLLALQLGGDDFLTRPIEPDHLVAAVLSRARRARNLCTFMVSDSLTGLLNHTKIKERLEAEVASARRHRLPLAHAMIDIDHFKRVNDTYGHATGDHVLKGLAQLLQQRLRKTDVIGRYGGEEFAVILPNTSADAALAVVDQIRAGFEQVRHQSEGTDFRVTFSAGVAAFPPFGDATRLSEAADKALYQAKQDGRNRVALAPAPPAPQG
jgi:diguanylate cyclase (GGDEF)-like protein